MSRPSNAARAALASAAFLFTLASHRTADAYCRTTTCNPKRENCPVDPVTGCGAVDVPFRWNQCPTNSLVSCTASAKYIAWPTSCVSYDLHAAGTPQVTFSDVEAAVTAAFDTWNAVNCGDAGALSIVTRDLGPVACGQKTFNKQPNVGNANIVTFVSPWTEDPTALALTTVMYSTASGDIVDADLEVNDERPLSAGRTTASGDNDLQAIVTHEAGHFLGLSHTQPREHSEAVMYEFYESGTDRTRALTADDIEGVCAIYPRQRATSGDDCQPVHGLGSECSEEVGGGCCAVSPARPRGRDRSPIALFTLGLMALCLRRRRSAHRATSVRRAAPRP
jgi:hypothetical protein